MTETDKPRKRGRPRKFARKLGDLVPLNCYPPAKVIDRLDREAAANGKSRSEQVVRILMERYGMEG